VPVKGRWWSAAGKVTAGLLESNCSLPLGGWLIVCGLTACTPGSAPGPTTLGNEYGKIAECCQGMLFYFALYHWQKCQISYKIRDVVLTKPGFFLQNVASFVENVKVTVAWMSVKFCSSSWCCLSFCPQPYCSNSCGCIFVKFMVILDIGDDWSVYPVPITTTFVLIGVSTLTWISMQFFFLHRFWKTTFWDVWHGHAFFSRPDALLSFS